MALYFISAASGAGKTTLMNELRRRGEEAHDTDTECIRASKLTGEEIDYVTAKAEGYDWIYPAEALKKLKLDSHEQDIFLLGNVDNFKEVKAAADEYIFMSIPREVLIERLDKRTKEYGKSESERKIILSVYDDMAQALDPSAFTLDATKPVEVIADDLLNHVKNRQ